MKSKPDINTVQNFLNSRSGDAKRQIYFSVLFAGLNGLLMIGGAWCLANIIKDIAFNRINLEAVVFKIILLAFIYFLRSLLVFAAEHFAFLGAVNIKFSVRQSIIKNILTNGPAGLGKEKSGAVIGAYMEGVEALHNYYALSLPSRITATMIPLAIFILVLPMDYISGLILLMTAPLIPIFMIWIGKGADKLSQKQWRRMAYLGGYCLDRIQGLTTLKLFNASHRQARVISKLSEEFRLDTMAVLRIAFLSSLALEFFATVSIAMIAVLIGFRLLWGELDFLQGFFVLLLAPEFYLPLRKMGANYHAKMEAIGASEKIIDFISLEKISDQKMDFADTSVSIFFDHVSFAYEDGFPILDDVSLKVSAGEWVALAGPSGSGKSTIISLLLGFIKPTSGQILINGRNLEDISSQSWHKNISWMAQKPRLFSGSIADNIKMAKFEANDAEINSLIATCGIKEFSQSPIGENGTGISGGQLQRVALARALIKSSPLLLLDEPTAHLDKENQDLMHKVLNLYARNSTILFAAHRETSLNNADRVIYLRSGKLFEQEEEDL